MNPFPTFLYVNHLAGFIILYCVLGGCRKGFQSILIGDLGISMLTVKLSPRISTPDLSQSPGAAYFTSLLQCSLSYCLSLVCRNFIRKPGEWERQMYVMSIGIKTKGKTLFGCVLGYICKDVAPQLNKTDKVWGMRCARGIMQGVSCKWYH